ncbi:hypothetical protein RvY_17903 [Ramazzottius varieornatus]|uniref:Chitin-binding type-2 domain-containing protein n=1 Tax=Ramazzottius varieornatus TaxID=947166 RepID=A0A1D1W3V8_RAMVA|nr:hypothetical protein RvY_17903 [Ramazzottius varieornatus]
MMKRLLPPLCGTTVLLMLVHVQAQPPLRPNGYDRCDQVYCRTKPDGYYQVQQCSSNYCRCSGSTAKIFSCAAGKYFYEQGPSCRTGDASWCPVKRPPNPPIPAAPWPAPPPFISAYCNAQNCFDRAGPPGPFFPLDICSPYWCYCSGLTGKVETCPPGQFFDYRSESGACVDRFTLPYC